MKLLTMEVVGFRAFKQEQRYEFSDRAGLFLVAGDNQAEPALGANGAGKSSFWDAVCWCLYGKTVRGVGAKHIESWGGRGTTRVSLTLEVDGQTVEVSRTRKPIAFTLDGEDVAQSVVDDLLALDYARFLQVCVLGQFGVLFADMKPTARLDLISQVLGLDVWHKAAKIAASRVKELDRQMHDADKSLHGLAVRTTTQGEALERLINRQETWEAEQDAREIELQDARIELQSTLAEDEKKLKALKLEVQNNESCTEELERKLGPLELQCRELESAFTVLRTDARHARAELKNRAARTAQLVGLGTGECPICEQGITEEHFDATLCAAEDKEQQAHDAVTEFAKRIEQSEKELECKDIEHADLLNLFTASERAFEKSRGRWIVENTKLKSLRRALETSELEIDAHKNAQNPLADEVDALRKAIAVGEHEHQEQEHAVFALLTELDLSGDWPRLFKELRLWMVDTALDELSIHVNGTLVALGLKRWTIEFVVERETESGTTSRGFDILVHAPGSPKGVPWESWSGGETQRLRVACAVGMATLIRSRMPSAPQFEVWDEPTAHLDGEGVRDLVSFFGDRADSRQVWLVDHRSLGSGAFDGTLTITKDAQGARWS